ncbi:MAG: LodA/GoxA family CTQ-dependent oxidase [Propionibacteriaceae bacterium]
MATTYRIHPAIGIARVGNSPDEFFVGPERPGEIPEPPGGFKDDQCRVKRQAARFRVYAHHDDGSSVQLTADQADISWTVHLRNTKAAHPDRGNAEPVADLTIDPGAQTLTGPDQRVALDGGSITFAGQPTTAVPLGEIRTDDDGRLLVLGGFGRSASPAGNVVGGFWRNDGWYDDVADGSVEATITLHADDSTPTVDGAWVLVTPPKFAPHQNTVTTLWDRIQQAMVDRGLLNAPTTTSYTADVQPILQRARDMRWVEGILGAHTWADPVTAQPVVDAIVARIAPPGGGGAANANMPRLNGESELTPIQYAHLLRWRAGTYAADWTGTAPLDPDVSADGLDRAALEACVGAAFFPGIEAGGLSAGDRPILETAYSAPWRIDHTAVAPGTISQAMALPWQADFKACGDNWWPVPRPNDVFTIPGGPTVRWDRDVASMDEMVNEWNRLGFVVKQGSEHLETQHCDELSITLLTPQLDFVDVGQGPMGMVREVPLAITFEVVAPGGPLTLQYAVGGGPTHPQLVAVDTSVTVGPTAPSAVATAQLWLVYRTDAVGSTLPTQLLTVTEPVSGRSWQVSVDGNTVARTTTATALALDRSGSMADDRGDGQSKHDSLQQAANMFVDLMLAGDGVGLVRFDQDAQPLQPVLALGTGGLSDLTRSASHDVINGNALDPGGATSIGDGIFEARALLDGASGFDRSALVVLTDGMENQPRWIADVSTGINATTYAVGFGRPQDISVPALQTVAGNHGGFLLTTGAITGDARFRLQKYFLQILSGIASSEVVLDPDGLLVPGVVQRIPFQVSDADSGVEVVLLTTQPDLVDFRLQTPNGLLVEPWQAVSDPAMQYVESEQTRCYRLALPLQLQPGRFDLAGTWHVVLSVGRPRTGRDLDEVDRSVLAGMRRVVPRGPQPRAMENERRFALARQAAGTAPPSGASAVAVRRLPYTVVVHAYSTLSFEVGVTQKSYEPGAEVTLLATLTQSGRPLAEASVWVETPGRETTTDRLELTPTGDAGTFEVTFPLRRPGVAELRVRARGRTRSGTPFSRERLLTAAVWRGGDQQPKPDPDDRR